MIRVTLADLRRSLELSEAEEVIAVEDRRRKKEVGYFIPISLEKEFRKFLKEVEQKQRAEKLRRVAGAQRKDVIPEGGLDEGLS